MRRNRILVADDDAAIAEAVTLLLEDEGYEVERAPAGRAVLQMQGDLPDLVLLDIWLSGADGGDLCRRLKAHPATRHIPVLLISANKDTAAIARECGSDDFIAKPFETSELLGKIARCLRQREALNGRRPG